VHEYGRMARGCLGERSRLGETKGESQAPAQGKGWIAFVSGGGKRTQSAEVTTPATSREGEGKTHFPAKKSTLAGIPWGGRGAGFPLKGKRVTFPCALMGKKPLRCLRKAMALVEKEKGGIANHERERRKKKRKGRKMGFH